MLTQGRRATSGATHDAGPSVVWGTPARLRTRVRRRDRRARGIRGPLAPRAVPAARSRAIRFDEEVLAAWDLLAAARPELQYIEIAVSDVPPASEPALAVFDPADAGLPARITVYRWAVELRAADPGQVRGLLRDVMTEQAAAFLGASARDLDGRYPRV
ncbi:MAG: hypothetical protein U0R28_07620 [Candidatus Nanopelagicales bacterium]